MVPEVFPEVFEQDFISGIDGGPIHSWQWRWNDWVPAILFELWSFHEFHALLLFCQVLIKFRNSFLPLNETFTLGMIFAEIMKMAAFVMLISSRFTFFSRFIVSVDFYNLIERSHL